jgi:pimeloyl-ACP methyl ester carboxylesterase
MRRIALALPLVALALGATPAAAEPLPFGHPCADTSDGVRLCPTASDDQRVPSFDGVPLDVDVTLPPASMGDGPFPTILMLHGYGGSKKSFEGISNSNPDFNNVFFAQHGYAVVNPSARGFGNSCGAASSRTSPACDKGWIHLDDQRYEARDVQWLLARLVDQLVARPDALGVTGISYGGGASMMLAMLADRIRRPDGTTESWQSPDGVPLAIAAAWARWPWTDLADALLPNGRSGLRTYASPVGVDIQAYVNALYQLANTSGFVAPAGADPDADLTTWKQRMDRGEPYGTDVRAILNKIHTYHGALGLPIDKGLTPLLIQSGWTDDLFPVGQGLRIYDLLRQKSSRAPVALQLGDLGHSRAANHPGDTAALNAQGLAFFNARLKHSGTGPAPGSVTAYTQTCPRKAAHGGGPYRATAYSRLARGKLVFRHNAAQRVTSSGGDATLAQKLSPLALDACKPVADQIARGTAVATLRSAGFTLLGMTHVRADVSVRGHDALLVGRLWDVDPAHGRQRLVDRGVIRLRSKKVVRFDLNGNGYRFARGHRVKLELLGRDSPTYRAANGTFSVTLRNLTVALPTRERQRAR